MRRTVIQHFVGSQAAAGALRRFRHRADHYGDVRIAVTTFTVATIY
jgi:hypothetical protein